VIPHTAQKKGSVQPKGNGAPPKSEGRSLMHKGHQNISLQEEGEVRSRGDWICLTPGRKREKRRLPGVAGGQWKRPRQINMKRGKGKKGVCKSRKKRCALGGTDPIGRGKERLGGLFGGLLGQKEETPREGKGKKKGDELTQKNRICREEMGKKERAYPVRGEERETGRNEIYSKKKSGTVKPLCEKKARRNQRNDELSPIQRHGGGKLKHNQWGEKSDWIKKTLSTRGISKSNVVKRKERYVATRKKRVRGEKDRQPGRENTELAVRCGKGGGKKKRKKNTGRKDRTGVRNPRQKNRRLKKKKDQEECLQNEDAHLQDFPPGCISIREGGEQS